MAQSLAKNLIHLIFSTKERQAMLSGTIHQALHAYAIGILKDQDSPCLAINSVSDHVHILFALSKNAPLAQVVMHVKRGTSRWIKTQAVQYRKFAWQNGYGAFSVSQSNAPEVCRYITGQVEHHRKVSLHEELVAFLKRHEVDYDERYIWE